MRKSYRLGEATFQQLGGTAMKPINLAKCKIGQRFQMRNGKIAILHKVESPITDNQPYLVRHEDENKEVDPYYYTSSGSFYSSGKSEFDIIAILPLPKKKAPPRLQKALNLPAPLDKQAIRAAIKTLQALLK